MDKVRKTDEEWRKELTPQQYQVARQKGTEFEPSEMLLVVAADPRFT